MSSAPEFSPKYPHTAAEDGENESANDSREFETEESQLGLEPIGLSKRKATPFTSTMDVALATAFTTEKNILDGTFREHGVPTRQQKQAAWERIRDCVNAFSGDTNLKTVQQCKDRHRNLIQAVRFKRSSGFLEGPLPMPANNVIQEMVDQQVNSIQQQHSQDKPTDRGPDHPQGSAPEQANGIPSTSAPILLPKEKRPPKRPSSSVESVEEYRKRKLAILVKEHIVRVELMKAQTDYYRAKTEMIAKQIGSSRPTSVPRSVPTSAPPKHLHPNVTENT